MEETKVCETVRCLYPVAPPHPRSCTHTILFIGEMVNARINKGPRAHEVTFRVKFTVYVVPRARGTGPLVML